LSTLPIPEIQNLTDEEDQLDAVWHVIVLNDPVNLMSYVVMVFKKIFGFDENKATKHMLEVHQKGRSTVWTGNRERAESYAYQLQHWRLQTVLEKDD
jgi:ATP-dependent Clp protease adaptor protein ClpS